MKVVIVLMAILAITNSVSSRRIRTLAGSFPDIQRIRPRQSITSDVQSPALNVLSHLAQSRALTPRRRKFSVRAGLPHPLPLEPTPRPLPIEIIREDQRIRASGQQSSVEDLAAYRPRPELRPQTQISTFDPTDELELELVTRTRPSNVPSNKSQRPQRPSVYSEDDTLYRRPEIQTESQIVQEPIDPSAYSQPELVFEGDVPVYVDDPSPNKRTPDTPDKSVRPRTPQRTRHRINRPRFSAEVQDVRKPVVVRAPARRPVEQQQYLRSQEEFDFPRTKVQEIREPLHEIGQRIVEHEIVQRPIRQRRPESLSTSSVEPIRQRRPESLSTSSVEPIRQRRPESVSTSYVEPARQRRPESFSTSSLGYRRRKPNPVQRYVEKAPVKQLKKKKVNPYKLAPLVKEKKPKRAISGGAHLDQNGIEFVEEARKVEGGQPDNRIAFQIHGAQGPNSYRFGFDTGKGSDRQFRYEERDNYGEVKGRYGYYDNYGKLQVVNYSAHPKLGFSADVPH